MVDSEERDDDGDDSGDGDIAAELPDEIRQFETTQRLDPDAFDHARSRVDGGFDTGVEAFVVDDGRLLLVCEDGRWSLPGGEVPEAGSREQALTDAVAAATGLTVDVGDALALNEVTLTDGERAATLSFVVYEATPVDEPGSVEPGRASISAVEWQESVPATTIDRDVLEALFDAA